MRCSKRARVCVRVLVRVHVSGRACMRIAVFSSACVCFDARPVPQPGDSVRCRTALRRLADGRRVGGPGEAKLGSPARAGAAAHGAEAAAHGTAGRMRGRRPVTGHGRARRDASATDIAALPAAADWPNLRILCVLRSRIALHRAPCCGWRPALRSGVGLHPLALPA
jgi:hypothetical protein